MKKLVSLLLASLLCLSLLAIAIPVAADETVTGQTEMLDCIITVTVTGQTEMPDWIITEIANDTQGFETNTNGYVGSQDPFEFIEIYNSSDRELNLYEYALTYESATRDSSNFEDRITESTPIKGGDFLDGSSLVPEEGQAVFGDLSNKPINPDTCMVAPGEVVVLWMVYYESYLADFNGGKGLSVDDFRAHWNIPEGVKVIAVDANSSEKNGGHGKNFNVKNSAVGTYGIAKQSAELDAATNVEDAPRLKGSYWESEHLVFWATMDFNDMMLNGSQANKTFNFTWDFAGYAAIDQAYTYYIDADYVYDARRGYMLTMYDEPSVGILTVFQKMTLGVELAAGETYTFVEDAIYYPFLEENFEGLKINGEHYDYNDTFTAEAAGVYSFDFLFESDLVTEAPTEEPTEAPTEEPTEAPTEMPTEAPTETPTAPPAEKTTDAPANESQAPDNTPTDTADPTEESGCGSVLGAAFLPCLLTAVALIWKKRED